MLRYRIIKIKFSWKVSITSRNSSVDLRFDTVFDKIRRIKSTLAYRIIRMYHPFYRTLTICSNSRAAHIHRWAITESTHSPPHNWPPFSINNSLTNPRREFSRRENSLRIISPIIWLTLGRRTSRTPCIHAYGNKRGTSTPDLGHPRLADGTHIECFSWETDTRGCRRYRLS